MRNNIFTFIGVHPFEKMGSKVDKHAMLTPRKKDISGGDIDILCYIREPSHVLNLQNFLIRKCAKVLEELKMGVKGPYLVEPTLFTKKS